MLVSIRGTLRAWSLCSVMLREVGEWWQDMLGAECYSMVSWWAHAACLPSDMGKGKLCYFLSPLPTITWEGFKVQLFSYFSILLYSPFTAKMVKSKLKVKSKSDKKWLLWTPLFKVNFCLLGQHWHFWSEDAGRYSHVTRKLVAGSLTTPSFLPFFPFREQSAAVANDTVTASFVYCVQCILVVSEWGVVGCRNGQLAIGLGVIMCNYVTLLLFNLGCG